MPPKKSINSIDALKKQIKKQKKLESDEEVKISREIEKEKQKEIKDKKDKRNKATLFEIQKFTELNKQILEKIGILDKKITDAEEALIEVDIDDENYKEKVKNIDRKIKDMKNKRVKFEQEISDNNKFIGELSRVKSGVEKGEIDVSDKDELAVIKVLKEILTERKKTLDRGEKFKSSIIKEKIDELLEEDVLKEENSEILKKIYKLNQSQIILFFNQYMRKDIYFFTLLDQFVNLLQKLDPEELEKLNKSELLELVNKKSIKENLRNKTKKEIITALLQDTCDPEMGIVCSGNKVCDITKNLCITNPSQKPSNWSLQLFKNSYLYGPTKELNKLYEKLKLLQKYEEDRLKERKYIPIEEEKEKKEKEDLLKTENVKDLDTKSKKVIRDILKAKDPEGKSIEKIEKVTFNPEKECVDVYTKRPWIKNYKTSYILNSDNSIPLSKYIEEGTSINFGGKTFYKVSTLFNFLNCNKNRGIRNQKDEVLTLFDEKDNLYRFMIIHQLNNGELIKQDENLFKKEKKWFKSQEGGVDERLEKIRYTELGGSDSFNSLLRSFIINSIETALNKVLENELKKDIEIRKLLNLDDEFRDKIFTKFQNLLTKYEGAGNKEKVLKLELFYNIISKDISEIISQGIKTGQGLSTLQSYLERTLKSLSEENDREDEKDIIEDFNSKVSKSVSDVKYEKKRLEENTNTHKIASNIEEEIRESMDQTNTVGEYLEKIANFYVFIDGKSKIYPFSDSFRARFIRQFYEPDYYVDLKLDEVLPHYLQSPDYSIEQKNKILINILTEINNRVLEFLRSIYMIINPTSKFIETQYLKRDVSYPPFMKTPSRHECIHDLLYEDWEILSYTEGDQVYCFNIYELFEKLLFGDLNNPQTGQPFPKDFINQLDSIYLDNKILRASIEEEKKDVSDEIKQKESDETLLKNIISAVKKSIKEDMVKIGYIEEELCKYCEKVLKEGSEKFKSIIKSDEEKGSRRVSFCSLQCFEELSFKKIKAPKEEKEE